jgi:hypothetical protein
MHIRKLITVNTIRIWVILITQICVVNITSLKAQPRSEVKFYLSASNCASCLMLAKYINKVPINLKTTIVTDAPTNSFEFNYLIDSMLYLNKERFLFEYMKNIPLELFNNVTITAGNQLIYRQSIPLLIKNFDTLNHFATYKTLFSYPLPDNFPLFKGTIVRYDDKKNLLCYDYTSGTLLHILPNNNTTYLFKDTYIETFEAYKTLMSGDTSGFYDYQRMINSGSIYAKPVQLENFTVSKDTLFIMYRVLYPNYKDSLKSQFSIIYKYIIYSYFNGTLISKFDVKGNAPNNSFIIDKDSNFIQSMAITNGIFEFDDNGTLLIGCSNIKYKESMPHFHRYDKKSNSFRLSTKQFSFKNPYLPFNENWSSSAINDFSFSNFACKHLNYIYFKRQLQVFDMTNKRWITFKSPKLTNDTLTHLPKNFNINFYVNNDSATFLHTNVVNNNTYLYYTRYKLKNGDIEYMEDITHLWKGGNSFVTLSKEGILIIDNNRTIKHLTIE